MQSFRPALTLLSVISGVLLILTGLSAIYFYLSTVIASLQQPDKSLIYWYLPFLFAGIILTTAGGWYTVIGIKANSDDYFYMLTRNSLLVLIVIVVFLLGGLYTSEYRADLHRQEAETTQEAVNALQKITSFEINKSDREALHISVTTRGEHSGTYRLVFTVYTSQNQFMENSLTLPLQHTQNTIQETIRFDEIFRLCQDTEPAADNYFCHDNTGTSNAKITISASLSPVDHSGEVQYMSHDAVSRAKRAVYLDTFTKDGVVQVERVRIE